MRALWVGLALCAALLAPGCTAVEDFGRFSFPSDRDLGGVPTDLSSGASDLAGNAGAFGAACTRPLECTAPNTCYTSSGPVNFPGGMCTRLCMLGACGTTATCTTVNGAMYCLPHCNDGMSPACRTGYTCCNNGRPTTSAGVCVPSTYCP